MIDKSWGDIKNSIYHVRDLELNHFAEVDGRHAIRYLIPVIDLLEKTDLENQIIKYLSLFNLICKVKRDDQVIEFPFIRLMPPGRLFNGTLDELWLSLIDKDINDDEISLMTEKFNCFESAKIAEKLYQLIIEQCES